ncbi:SdpI family protein [Candidatus Micrarchaeota archaeon]|nr:SdpI family protein [Candidatus Micrarchaeota archaeon]
MRTNAALILTIIILSFLIGAYFYPQMPDAFASHWNAAGEVDSYAPKLWGLFTMPVILVIILIFIVLIPRIDPLKANIGKFREYYDTFSIIVALFFFYLDLLVILWNIGVKFDLMQLLVPAFAVLLYYSGVLTENSKRNWFIGIQTPWTMSSDKVWNKTNKFCGKLSKATAIIALLGIFFPYYAVLIIAIPVIVLAVYSVIYSYIEYQRER